LLTPPRPPPSLPRPVLAPAPALPAKPPLPPPPSLPVTLFALGPPLPLLASLSRPCFASSKRGLGDEGHPDCLGPYDWYMMRSRVYNTVMRSKNY
ncbi:hypothetical protein CH063_16023, partial [Colletotrichum higginsianum]